jgi:hypothetical protein
MKSYLIKANAHYNDLTGTVAVDFEESHDNFQKLIERNGFNSEEYLPYAFSFCYPEAFLEYLNITKEDGHFIIHAVSKKDFADSYQNFTKKLETYNGEIPTYEFSFKITAKELFKHFKQFCMTFDKISLFNYWSDVYSREVIEEIDLEENN